MLGQDSALDFYCTKLGFEVRRDVDLGGFRWLTVGSPMQPDVQIVLACPGPPMVDEQAGEQLRALVAKGVLGGAVFRTDDCRKTFEELSGRGVTFLQEPAERPYGVEALLRDNSGNWFSLTQPSE